MGVRFIVKQSLKLGVVFFTIAFFIRDVNYELVETQKARLLGYYEKMKILRDSVHSNQSGPSLHSENSSQQLTKSLKNKEPTQTVNSELLCPKPREGPIKLETENITLNWVQKKFPDIQGQIPLGPTACTARKRVAVIVPYGNRPTQLPVVINHIHKLLRYQQLTYGIFVVEPHFNNSYNKAMLLNIGFLESVKINPQWDCFVFHDVDLLVENYGNNYACGSKPKLLVNLMKKSFWRNYQRRYGTAMGGVITISKEQHIKVNGYSNFYWGWGLEDDDYSARLRDKRIGGYKLERTPEKLGKAIMLEHKNRGDKKNPENYCRHAVRRHTLKKDGYREDGLSTIRYTLLNITVTPLFRHIFVDLRETESRIRIHELGICKWKGSKKATGRTAKKSTDKKDNDKKDNDKKDASKKADQQKETDKKITDQKKNPTHSSDQKDPDKKNKDKKPVDKKKRK